MRRQITSAIPVQPDWGRPDWIVILLPTALSLRNLSSGGGNTLITLTAVFVIVVLVAAAFRRPSETKFPTNYAPMMLFFASSALLIIRPASMFAAVMAVLVGALAFRLAATVEVRKLIASLIDGLGLYCLLNIALYVLGVRSVGEGFRQFLSTGGENRIIYPLERSLSLPPAVAAMYIAGVLFLLRGQGGKWRIFRLVCLAAAVGIILGSATRVPAAAAVVVPAIVILLPMLRRYLAAAVVALAAVSSMVLPGLVGSTQFLLTPLAGLISSRRSNTDSGLVELNGRDFLWDHALAFWDQRVTDLFYVLFGYGMEGHYRSGASSTYFRLLSDSITKDPARTISVHNSFLQQLFDGGLVGLLLMTISLLWVAFRLSALVSKLGPPGVAIVSAFTVLIMCSMTEVLLHPSVLTYWMLLVFIAIACQIPGGTSPEAGALQRAWAWISTPASPTRGASSRSKW